MLLLIIKSDTFTPLVSTVVHWQSGIADAVPIVRRERQAAGNRRPALAPLRSDVLIARLALKMLAKAGSWRAPEPRVGLVRMVPWWLLLLARAAGASIISDKHAESL